MQRKSLRILIKLVAAEKNLHQLISRVAADVELLQTTRDFYTGGTGSGAFHDEQVRQLCESCLLPLETFQERLKKVAYALNLSGLQEDYYGILGLDNGAGIEEIKGAFRRLSFACHPDKNPNDPEAGERFRKLHHAYRVLSKVETKQQYDDSLVVPTWIEPLPVPEEETKASDRQWKKLHRVWPIGLFVVFLVLLSFFVDFQTWQTSRYYQARNDNRLSVGGMAYPSLGKMVQERYTPWDHLKMKNVRMRKNLETSPLPVSLLSYLQELSRFGPREKLQRAPEAPVGASPPVVIADDHSRKVDFTPVASPILDPERMHGGERSLSQQTGSSNLLEKETAPPALAMLPSKEESSALLRSESGKSVKEEPVRVKDESIGKTKPPINDKSPAPASAITKTPSAQGFSENSMNTERRAQVKNVSEYSNSSLAEKGRVPAKSIVGNGEASSQTILSVDEMNRTLVSFLNRYVDAYKSRNTKTFFSLFDPEATENGEPLKNLRTLYVENFQKAERIDYTIKLSGWSIHQESIKIDADFRLAVKLVGESPTDTRGEMRMFVDWCGRDLKVKRLDYSFH